jgi:hypothetical protein
MKTWRMDADRDDPRIRAIVLGGGSEGKDLKGRAFDGAALRLADGVTLLAKFDGEFASHSSTYAGTGTLR